MPSDHDVQREIEQLEQRFAENAKGLVFAHLADAYRRAGEFAKAEGLILHGLKNHPSYTSAYNVLGRIYLDVERYADAHDQFSRVLQLDPHNLIALRALGDLAAQSNRLDEARSWYEQMLQIDPRNEEVREELRRLASQGPASESEGNADLGREELAASTSEWPEPSLSSHLGDVYGREDGFSFSDDFAESGDDKGLGETMPWEHIRDVSSLEPDTAETKEPELPPLPEEAEEPVGFGGKAEEEPEPSRGDFRHEEPGSLDLGDLESWTPGFFEDAEGEASELELGAGDFAEDSFIDALEQGFEVTLADDETGKEDSAAGAGGGLVTETMAELYARQGLYADALRVYQQLADVRPSDDRIQKRLSELRAQIAEVEATPPPKDDLAELLEITGTPSSELAEASVLPEAVAEEAFVFEDEAPIAGLEQLDPFAVSFDVMARRDGQEVPAPGEKVRRPGDEVEVESGGEFEAERVGEQFERSTTAEPVMPDELPAVAAELSRSSAAAQEESSLAEERIDVPSSSIEDYLRGLLAFDPEASSRRQRPSRDEAASGFRSGGARSSGSDDLEQFQEWLRGLKR